MGVSKGVPVPELKFSENVEDNDVSHSIFVNTMLESIAVKASM